MSSYEDGERPHWVKCRRSPVGRTPAMGSRLAPNAAQLVQSSRSGPPRAV